MKINKNIARWVIDIYLTYYPTEKTYISLKDFSQRYKVSYPTMRKYLPLFFDLRLKASFLNSATHYTFLEKKAEIQLYFDCLKKINSSRSYENIMSLFFSLPTAVNIVKNRIQNL